MRIMSLASPCMLLNLSVCLHCTYSSMCTVVYVQLIARMLEVAFLWVPLSESQLCDCMIISQARLGPLMGGPLL